MESSKSLTRIAPWIYGAACGFFAAWIPLPPFPYWWAVHYYETYTPGNWNALVFLFHLTLLSVGGFIAGGILTNTLYAKYKKAFQLVGIASIIGGLCGLATLSDILSRS